MSERNPIVSIVCRRACRLGAVLGAPLLLGACIHLSGKSPAASSSASADDDAGSPTASAQEKSKAPRRPAAPATYDELVSSVLVSQDRQKLVILGAEHDFVFSMPNGIAAALKVPFRRAIAAEFGEFRIHPDGVVTGNYQLVMSKEDSAAHFDAASAIGFAELGSGDHLRMLGRLYGVRYYADRATAPASRLKLNAPYRVRVINQVAGEAAAKVAATPVAATADGGLAIAATPLVAIGLGVAPGNCAGKKCTPGG